MTLPRGVSSPYRTHPCGELGPELEGTTVQLAGWVRRRRDHGGLIFVDLADYAGFAQIVFNPDHADAFAVGEKLRSEYVVQISGTVRRRPAGTENSQLKTGAVEVAAERQRRDGSRSRDAGQRPGACEHLVVVPHGRGNLFFRCAGGEA